jgi:hypothetical protein
VVFLFLSMAFAWVSAVCAGYANFYANMNRYYTYQSLHTYTDIYPDRVRGEALMDVGAITFAESAFLDSEKSMAFRNNGVMYCAAPISNGDATLADYDFWAVGKDCCTAQRGSFYCPYKGSPASDHNLRSLGADYKHDREASSGLLQQRSSGLRILSDSDLPYYRLAVRQAEATYNIHAIHPLFLEWTVDAPAVVDSWGDEGLNSYLQGIFVHICVQATLVLVAVFTFSKIGSSERKGPAPLFRGA